MMPDIREMSNYVPTSEIKARMRCWHKCKNGLNKTDDGIVPVCYNVFDCIMWEERDEDRGEAVIG